MFSLDSSPIKGLRLIEPFERGLLLPITLQFKGNIMTFNLYLQHKRRNYRQPTEGKRNQINVFSFTHFLHQLSNKFGSIRSLHQLVNTYVCGAVRVSSTSIDHQILYECQKLYEDIGAVPVCVRCTVHFNGNQQQQPVAYKLQILEQQIQRFCCFCIAAAVYIAAFSSFLLDCDCGSRVVEFTCYVTQSLESQVHLLEMCEFTLLGGSLRAQ